MKAQKEVMRDPTNPIRLTDKLSIYQEEIIENDNLYWKLYLNKEGEKEPKLLDKDETLYIEDETVMFIPKQIDAYMEGKYLYVFLYKDHKAMLEIYCFEDGVKFEKTGYLLHYFQEGWSVMNFGGYKYYVDIKEIGEYHYIKYFAKRNIGGNSGVRLLKIKEDDINEIKIKEATEKTIFYPYIIKELDEDITEEQEKSILFKELKKQLEANNLLAPNTLIYSAGYIKGKWIYYIFYKTTDVPNKINMVIYGSYSINHKSYYGWQFCDYTEEPLMPEYSKWKPQRK